MKDDYFKSLSLEMESLKDRVRSFIYDHHWLTDGEWKEGVLRSMIARNLPASINIGKGFIISPEGPSTQIDVLIYSSDSPVLFREGDLVFAPPSAVKGIIEVKTKINNSEIKKQILRLQKIGALLPKENDVFLSLFAYESHYEDYNSESILEFLYNQKISRNQLLNFMCLGPDRFIRYWNNDPINNFENKYQKWHSYHCEKMAYGYFIHNALLHLCPKYINNGSKDLWFPIEGKEQYKERESSKIKFIEENDLF